MSVVASAREIGMSYQINFLGRQGTCFASRDAQGSYFVTAAHLMKGAAAGDKVQFRRVTDWVDVGIRDIVFAAQQADVCVFSSVNFTLTLVGEFPDSGEVGVAPGGETIFVGYPHGLTNTFPNNNGFVSALVRKAFFSGVIAVDGREVMILDGFNNPGYSGSPVYIADGPNMLVPWAVISGYRHESAAHGGVFKKVGGIEEQVPDVYVKANSGMIVAESWSHVTDALKLLPTRNPAPKAATT